MGLKFNGQKFPSANSVRHALLLYLIPLQMQEWGWFDMSCIGSPQVLVIGPQILVFCPVPLQGTQISCLIFSPSQRRMVALRRRKVGEQVDMSGPPEF